jgi:hypothetical protein
MRGLIRRIPLALLLPSSVVGPALGQTAPEPQSNLPPVSYPPVESGITRVGGLDSVELWLAVLIMLFGFAVLYLQYRLLTRCMQPPSPSDILRAFTVTIVIVGTMALIAVGYSTAQLTPALGLFGSIIGYLLGRAHDSTSQKAPENEGKSEESQSDPAPGRRERT